MARSQACARAAPRGTAAPVSAWRHQRKSAVFSAGPCLLAPEGATLCAPISRSTVLPKNYDDQGLSSQPVYVIETIPVPGAHEVSADEIKREAIPIPAHLRLYPELGRGGMGRIHPATDRNLLRHVALKRLDQELSKEPFYR